MVNAFDDRRRCMSEEEGNEGLRMVDGFDDRLNA